MGRSNRRPTRNAHHSQAELVKPSPSYAPSTTMEKEKIEVESTMASTDQLPQLSGAYEANSHWLMEHLADVACDHPNQWVAVHGQRIIAADVDLGVVTASITPTAATSDVVFHFVDDGSLIFAAF